MPCQSAFIIFFNFYFTKKKNIIQDVYLILQSLKFHILTKKVETIITICFFMVKGRICSKQNYQVSNIKCLCYFT